MLNFESQKYHTWVKDPELLELTTSEQLTLAQEIEVQREFISRLHHLIVILAVSFDLHNKISSRQGCGTWTTTVKFYLIGSLSLFGSQNAPEPELTFIVLARRSASDNTRVLTPKDIQSLPMIGDVSMFFKEDSEVECEVMIAGQHPHSSFLGSL
jgi:hypothetical protein